MNKRTITLHILIGLPGSGKTCFAQNIKARHPNDIMILGENELQDTDWRIYKRDTGKRFPPMNTNELQQNINAYSGAVFKTLIMDGLFLTTERVLEVIQLVSSKFTLKEIVLDYWPENREECLRNDYLRRRRGSSLSIESLSVQTDFNVIRAAYPNTVIATHSVYHTPDWVIFFRPYLTLTDERELRSEEWTTGGEYWSYNGDRSPISPEEAPTSFQELDNLLEKICPDISFLQYKKITSDCVSVKEREDSDYYSCAVKQYFVCDLETLYEDLCLFGYIHPDSESTQDTELTAGEMEVICSLSEKNKISMSLLESAAWKLYTKTLKQQETASTIH